MKELCYSALDVAVIVSSMQLGCREESRILDLIWESEKVFLAIPYRTNQRKFILDTYHWMQYFYDKPTIDKEFPAIQKDLAKRSTDSESALSRALQADQFTSDFSDLDLFFKSMRIRILYGNGNDYVRIKLRTLLRQYGYKRRSQQLLQHINRCMLFYHLEAGVRGGISCLIEEVNLDQMLTFRVV